MGLIHRSERPLLTITTYTYVYSERQRQGARRTLRRGRWPYLGASNGNRRGKAGSQATPHIARILLMTWSAALPDDLLRRSGGRLRTVNIVTMSAFGAIVVYIARMLALGYVYFLLNDGSGRCACSGNGVA